MRRHSHIHDKLILFLLLATGLPACSLFGPDEIASIRDFSGEVQVEAEGEEPVTVRKDHGLYEGNVITTGADSAATIEFEGGNRIGLNDNARLVIRRSGSQAEIGAVLLGGTAQVTSTGGGFSLTIGTPLGLATVGGEEVSLEIGVETGIKVLIGQVVVELEEGATTVQAGNIMRVNGLVVPIGAAIDGLDVSIGGMKLDPIVVTLLANSKQVQVKRSGEKVWRAPKNRDQLNAGDAIRTRDAASTNVQFADGASVTMSADSELELLDAGATETAQRAKYSLNRGTARVQISKRGKDVHIIEANRASLEVKPGRTEADIDVTAGRKGHSRIDVRLGEVKLSDGTTIEAGSTVNLKNGKLAGEIRELSDEGVSLRAKSSAVINYLGDVPAVAFSWKGDKKKSGPWGYAIELAKDRDFKQPLFGEDLNRESFVFDGFEPGRYFWRVETAEGWTQGNFKIQKHAESDCPNCRRVNNIDDNGERAKVFYQQTLPAITFRWKAVDGVANYRIKVFVDGSFDKPDIDQDTKETQLPLKAGRLEEGKYFWHVVALDATGSEISTSPQMNSLEIAYDNVVTALKIKKPEHGAKIKGSAVTAVGIVELGVRLWINGSAVPSDSQGRFRHSIPLEKGSNRLVFRILGKDGVERFYLREVQRR